VITFVLFIWEDIRNCVPKEENTRGIDKTIDGGSWDDPVSGQCTKKKNWFSCIFCPFKKKNPPPSGCKYSVK
jgi:hypothetical protein